MQPVLFEKHVSPLILRLDERDSASHVLNIYLELPMLKKGPENLSHTTSISTRIFYPSRVAELQELVRGISKVKAFGTGHSFNGISDSTDARISLQQMNQVIDFDVTTQKVTVEAGIRYGELAQYLHECGFALRNLASLPHIAVAGASATGSHGSGDNNQCLSSALSAIELVDARGEIIQLSSDEPRFGASIVNLGALGIATKLTLDVVQTFGIKQTVYEKLPLEILQTHFDAIFASAYSVSLFTDWNPNYVNQMWVKALATDPRHAHTSRELFGAKAADGPRHPVLGFDPTNCTEQRGVVGPWYERLPHFRMGFTPSCGDELQSEYFVPRQYGLAAYEAVLGMRDYFGHLLLISEVRSVASDNQWLSPCSGRDSIAIHFTWKPNLDAVRNVLPIVEKALSPFFARPHWGKLFGMNADQLHPLYPKLPDFRRVMREFDPHGKFLNPFLLEYVEKPLSFDGLL